MKYYLLILFFLISSCASNESKKTHNDLDFNNIIDTDEFIIKLKAYSDKNPYPEIEN
tara:strand:+ start:238 stop:408 length:171 start_codon:yes stop_codon:yes gene_type:complete